MNDDFPSNFYEVAQYGSQNGCILYTSLKSVIDTFPKKLVVFIIPTTS